MPTIIETAEMSKRVADWIENDKSIPRYVNFESKQVQMPQFLEMMTRTVYQIADNNLDAIIEERGIRNPPTPAESVNNAQLQKADYVDLARRVSQYCNDNATAPPYAICGIGSPCYQNLIYMFSRVLRWYHKEKTLPNYVQVTKWTMEPKLEPVPSPTSKGHIQTACERTLGSFSNFTQFYNKMKGRGYGSYYNDIKTLAQEEATLSNLNCSDATQLGVFLAREMGYTARFCHVYCKSGSGHIYGQISGKEFGTGWTKFDLAAAMSKSSMYNIGKVWCSDAKISSYNDSWLESDDGVT